VAWTGTNGNLVGTSAGGSVSYGTFEGSNIVLQGGINNTMAGSFGNTASIPEVAALESFSVYPNPTTGLVFVDVPQNVTIQVYTLQGQLVHTSVAGEIDITNLTAGMYIVHAPGYKSTRIIKK